MHLYLGYIENIDFNFDMQCMKKKRKGNNNEEYFLFKFN